MKKFLVALLLITSFLAQAGYKTNVLLGDKEEVIDALNGRFLSIYKREVIDGFIVYSDNRNNNDFRYFFKNDKCIMIRSILYTRDQIYQIGAYYNSILHKSYKIKPLSRVKIGEAMEWIDESDNGIYVYRHVYKPDKYSQYYYSDQIEATNYQIDELKKKRAVIKNKRESDKQLYIKNRESKFYPLRRQGMVIKDHYKTRDKVSNLLSSHFSKKKGEFDAKFSVKVKVKYSGEVTCKLNKEKLDSVSSAELDSLVQRISQIDFNVYYEKYDDIPVSYFFTASVHEKRIKSEVLIENNGGQLSILEGDTAVFTKHESYIAYAINKTEYGNGKYLMSVIESSSGDQRAVIDASVVKYKAGLARNAWTLTKFIGGLLLIIAGVAGAT